MQLEFYKGARSTSVAVDPAGQKAGLHVSRNGEWSSSYSLRGYMHTISRILSVLTPHSPTGH